MLPVIGDMLHRLVAHAVSASKMPRDVAVERVGVFVPTALLCAR